jgi:cytochrome c oxidase subunit IV
MLLIELSISAFSLWGVYLITHLKKAGLIVGAIAHVMWAGLFIHNEQWGILLEILVSLYLYIAGVKRHYF